MKVHIDNHIPKFVTIVQFFDNALHKYKMLDAPRDKDISTNVMHCTYVRCYHLYLLLKMSKLMIKHTFQGYKNKKPQNKCFVMVYQK